MIYCATSVISMLLISHWKQWQGRLTAVERDNMSNALRTELALISSIEWGRQGCQLWTKFLSNGHLPNALTPLRILGTWTGKYQVQNSGRNCFLVLVPWKTHLQLTPFAFNIVNQSWAEVSVMPGPTHTLIFIAAGSPQLGIPMTIST